MNKKRQFLSYVLVFFAICVPAFSMAANTGIAVTPAVLEVDATAGEVITGALTIKNTAEVRRTIRLEAATFDVDDSGVTQLIMEPSALTRVVFQSSELVLESGEVVSVPYELWVEGNAIGTVRVAVALTTLCDPVTASTQLCVRARLGVPIVLTVDGAETSGAGYVEFDDMPWVIIGAQTVFDVVVHNVGERVFRPYGNVVVSSLARHEKVSARITQQHMVLPERARTFGVVLYHPELFGVYELTVDVTDGDGVLHQKRRFVLIFSNYIALIALVFVGMSVAAWWLWYRRLKKNMREVDVEKD